MLALIVFVAVQFPSFVPVQPRQDDEAEPALVDHSAADRAAITELAAQLSAPDPKTRVAGLRAVAALTASHAGHPSPVVAEALAAALDDVDYDVRRHALRLLLGGQHTETALAAFTSALESVVKEVPRLRKGFDDKYERLFEKQGKATTDDVIDELPHASYLAELLQAAGQIPDRRMEVAVLDVLKIGPKQLPAPLCVAASVSAMRLGTQAGVDAAVDFLGDYRKATKKKPLENAYPKAKPGTLAALMSQLVEPMGDEEYRAVATESLSISTRLGVDSPGSIEPADMRKIQQEFKRIKRGCPSNSAPSTEGCTSSSSRSTHRSRRVSEGDATQSSASMSSPGHDERSDSPASGSCFASLRKAERRPSSITGW